MSISRLKFLATGLAFIVAGEATAQMTSDEPPACTAVMAPTGELAAWITPVAVTAAGREGRSSAAPLMVGQAAQVTLLPTPEVAYPVRPDKPGGSVSYGGLLRLEVRQAGTYRIALGSGAWLDLVARGKALTSVAHGRGPACTGIRKMVDFALTPGRHTLQIAVNGEPQVTVMAVRLP